MEPSSSTKANHRTEQRATCDRFSCHNVSSGALGRSRAILPRVTPWGEIRRRWKSGGATTGASARHSSGFTLRRSSCGPSCVARTGRSTASAHASSSGSITSRSTLTSSSSAQSRSGPCGTLTATWSAATLRQSRACAKLSAETLSSLRAPQPPHGGHGGVRARRADVPSSKHTFLRCCRRLAPRKAAFIESAGNAGRTERLA